jgi:hypothetical protein
MWWLCSMVLLSVVLWAQPRPLPPVAPTLEADPMRLQRPGFALDPRLEERLRRAESLLPIEGVWAVRLELFDTTGGDIRMVREDYTFELLIVRAEEGMAEQLTATVVQSQTERIPVGTPLAELRLTADPQLYLAEWHLPASRTARSELKLEGAIATAELRDVPRYPLVATIRMVKLRPRPWQSPPR